MNNIIIERGIPPPTLTRRGRPSHTGLWQRILASMGPGDSFVVPSYDQTCNVRKAASSRGLRVITAKENGRGFRIWRL